MPKASSPLVFFQCCPVLESLPASLSPSGSFCSALSPGMPCPPQRTRLKSGALLAQLPVSLLGWLCPFLLPSPVLQPLRKVALCQLTRPTGCPLASPPLNLPSFPHHLFQLVPWQQCSVVGWEAWSELERSYLLRAGGRWAAQGEVRSPIMRCSSPEHTHTNTRVLQRGGVGSAQLVVGGRGTSTVPPSPFVSGQGVSVLLL